MKQAINITPAQAYVFDALVGLYGADRAEVMQYLLVTAIDRLDKRRPLRETMDECRLLKMSAER